MSIAYQQIYPQDLWTSATRAVAQHEKTMEWKKHAPKPVQIALQDRQPKIGTRITHCIFSEPAK
jgi:hypothetical protein